MSKAEEANTKAPIQEPVPEENSKKKGKRESEKQKALDNEARLTAAEERLAEAETRALELNEHLLRTAAEYENHRKRSQRENETAFGNGVCHSAKELLPVLDTLNAAANAPTTDEEYKKGVMMTLKTCRDIFEKLGIHEMEAEGQAFDPQLHNAVMQKEVEGVESGTVTEVLQKGYMLKDKVIRHAMVAVAP